MTTQTTYPDYMLDMRAWLRNHPYLAELSGGRVFFRIPPKPSAAPFVRIYQSGGGGQAEEADAPVLDIRLGIDVWGMAGSDYPAIRATTLALYAIAHDTPPMTQLIGPTSSVYAWGNTVHMNMNITTALDSVDPDTGWPRKVLDAVWTVRHG